MREYMTNGTETPSAMSLKPGAQFNGIIDDTPDWHGFLLFFALVLGFVAIVITFSLALRAQRKSMPTHGHRKIIATATAIIMASSLMHFLLSTADWLHLVATSDAMSVRALSQCCAIDLAGQMQLLAFSIGFATIGVVAHILIASGRKENRYPQPSPAGDVAKSAAPEE